MDKVASTTTLTWLQEIGNGPYAQASKQVSVYALRVTAAPFGANAPAWGTLSPTLNNSDGKTSGAPYQNDWDAPTIMLELTAEGFAPVVESTALSSRAVQVNEGDFFVPITANPWYYIPIPGDLSTVLSLDAVYKQLNYTAQNPGWAVLLTGGSSRSCTSSTRGKRRRWPTR